MSQLEREGLGTQVHAYFGIVYYKHATTGKRLSNFFLGYFPESYCWSHPSDPESFLGGSLVRIAVVERQGGGSTEGRLSRVCR